MSINELTVTELGSMPWKNGKVFLNGEEVTNDVYKIEINVRDILLYRIRRPIEISADGENAVRYVTKIDVLKVN
jgi:hypothetical protein